MHDGDEMIRRAVEVDGYRHAYASVEPAVATTPPVLAVHGFGTSGYRTFRHVARHFKEAGIPLYAVDLLGFGDSDAARIPYSLELYAQLITSLANALGLARPIVLGHSMGGKIAAAAAVLHPQVYSGLVLVNSGGFSRTERFLPLVARSWWARRLLAQDWFFHRVLPHTRLGAVLQTDENRTQLAKLRHSHGALDLKRSGIRSRLRSLEIPTLIVWGDGDRVLPQSTPARAHSFIPHARLRMIRGAGHAPMKDQPERFTAAIVPFAQEIARFSRT